MRILGIETSCDETAISIVEAEGDINSLSFKLLGSAVNSQIDIHKEYGGVFPTLAKREHEKNLPIVLEEALKEAGFEDELGIMNYELWEKNKPGKKFPIDMIAVTVGPGLEPALWTGIKFAEELGKNWGVKVVGANHMEGHIASVLLAQNHESRIMNQGVEFPALALLISGGHTELVLMESWHDKKKIGETLDDAVGEAFDKVARMLDLPYPGGPEISRLAEEARKEGIQQEKNFPRPMLHSKDYNFSFSGLKTSVLYYIRDLISKGKDNTSPPPNPLPLGEGAGGGAKEDLPKLSENQKKEIAREFEDAVVEVLLSKTKKAIQEFSPKSIIVGGGVIANKLIREKILELENSFLWPKVYIPEKSLTTDNATMIAISAYIDSLRKESKEYELKADGNLDI